jgi:hypothetical protein
MEMTRVWSTVDMEKIFSGWEYSPVREEVRGS